MSKSYFGMDVKVCPVCGKEHEVGILLDRRLKSTLEQRNVTGFGMCDEHEEMRKQGFVALVECDPTKSEIRSDNTVGADGVWRTGTVAHLRSNVYEQIFGNTSKQGIAFVEIGVIQRIIDMASHENQG